MRRQTSDQIKKSREFYRVARHLSDQQWYDRLMKISNPLQRVRTAARIWYIWCDKRPLPLTKSLFCDWLYSKDEFPDDFEQMKTGLMAVGYPEFIATEQARRKERNQSKVKDQNVQLDKVLLY